MKKIMIAIIIMVYSSIAMADAKLVNNLRNQSVAILAPSGSGKIMSGTGTLFRSRNKVYSLTCYHVVEGAISNDQTYNVTVFSDEFVRGKLVKRHVTTAKVVKYTPRFRGNDIAILELKDSHFGLGYAQFYVGDIPGAGTDIYHIGYFQGQYPLSSSKGIISYIDRPINGGRRDHLDTTMYGGSSGGGIWDVNGNYIGMLSDGVDNRIGFMIPVRQILDFLSKEMPELLP